MKSYHGRERGTLETERLNRRRSLRTAVDAKCRDCIYDPMSGAGTWREQVSQCRIVSCPLWALRPMPVSGPFAAAPRIPAEIVAGQSRSTVGSAFSGNQPDMVSP